MGTNANKMRQMLTKTPLSMDALCELFDISTLELMVSTCNMLEGMIRLDIQVLTQTSVIEVANEDLIQLNNNLNVIRCAVSLKELKLETICLN